MNIIVQWLKQHEHQWVLIPLMLLTFSCLTFAVYHYAIIEPINRGGSPIGVDWLFGLRPALVRLLTGGSPYISDGWYVFAPPWVLILYTPFLLLSPELGAAVVIVLGWFAFMFAAVRLGAKPVALVALSLSYPVLHASGQANIDHLIPLSLLLPPQLGLFFVVAKPQLGIGIALYWLFQAFERGGWQEVIRVFSPVTVALLVTFSFYGFYFLRGSLLLGSGHAISMFPYSLPFAIWLLSFAIRKRQPSAAMAASPLFSPYVGRYSWAVSFYGLLNHPKEMVIAVLLFWGGWAFQSLTGS